MSRTASSRWILFAMPWDGWEIGICRAVVKDCTSYFSLLVDDVSDTSNSQDRAPHTTTLESIKVGGLLPEVTIEHVSPAPSYIYDLERAPIVRYGSSFAKSKYAQIGKFSSGVSRELSDPTRFFSLVLVSLHPTT